MPIAYEGALKLKEISYIHAEGYPAGEMKHGPIALIDKAMPVVCLAPQDPWHEKMVSQIQQAKARGGTVIAVATDGDTLIQGMADHVLWVPQISLDAFPCGDGPPLAAPGVSYRYHPGSGCRPAAEPCKKRNGRMTLARRSPNFGMWTSQNSESSSSPLWDREA